MLRDSYLENHLVMETSLDSNFRTHSPPAKVVADKNIQSEMIGGYWARQKMKDRFS